MTWNHRYQVKSYLRSSLWVIPLVALPLQQVAWALARTLDTRLAWKGLGLGVTGAQAMFNAVITFTLSFIVFTFGSLLIAIQVAGGQYTPRIIATTLLRDNVIRYTVGLFVFTFLFAIKALDRTETTVHQLVAFVTGLLGLICIVAFLFLIDYAARMLRPVSLIRRVGEYGLKVMQSVYPEQSTEAQSTAESRQSPGPAERTILHRGKSAIVVAVNVETLVAEAEKAKRVIELAPQVGDFVGSGEPLFMLHDAADAVDERKLRAAVVFGDERTMEQDPLFTFRILVDIGIKALSKAINDPTTAVLAIDQLHRLLRSAGKRNLRTDHSLEKFLGEQEKISGSRQNKTIAPVIQKLKAWREANNLSQAQAVVVLVAAGLPANVKTLQGWEIGRHSPQPITAAALARFLEKNPNVSHPSARTTFLHAPQLECQEMKNQEV